MKCIIPKFNCNNLIKFLNEKNYKFEIDYSHHIDPISLFKDYDISYIFSPDITLYIKNKVYNIYLYNIIDMDSPAKCFDIYRLYAKEDKIAYECKKEKDIISYIENVL